MRGEAKVVSSLPQQSYRCTVAPIKWVAYDTDIECSKPEKFGMYHGQPCLMLKLNKVYGWEPEPFYNISEVSLALTQQQMFSLTDCSFRSCPWSGCRAS